MECGDPHNDFKHTTLKVMPESYDSATKTWTPKRVGITLLDEKPGFTGIYIRDAAGGLWPARTVSHEPPEHHASVRGRGIPDVVLKFLSSDIRNIDPRVFVILNWDWVRGRFIEIRSPGFWLRRIEDDSLKTIRDAADFWSAQKQLSEFDIVDVTELATGARYEISVVRLRDPHISAAQILAKAFRKPDLIDG